MNDKFQNKYRIPSTRLQNWDYGWNAAYFVTICTAGRECYFGDIVDGEMQLSEIGLMAKKYWDEIPQHFTFVILDKFVVMPNHVHGIIAINKPDDGRDDAANVATQTVKTPKLGVFTIPANDTNPTIPANDSNPTNPTNRTVAASEKWNPGTLGVIINQYKRVCTLNARQIHAGFAWQSRFHDHIIRNDESFQRITNYIYNNPANWQDDKFHNET